MKTVHDSCTRIVISVVLGLCAMVLLTPSPLHGQLLTFSKQELADYTAQSNFERLPDGRPKVPDDLIERARELSSEEVWADVRSCSVPCSRLAPAWRMST